MAKVFLEGGEELECGEGLEGGEELECGEGLEGGEVFGNSEYNR